MITSFAPQDTLRQKVFIRQDSIKQSADSSVNKDLVTGDSAIPVKTVYFGPILKIENTDTTSVCSRNPIADVTFFDTTNIVPRIDGRIIQNFPFVFTENNRKLFEETKADFVSHLKSGKELPSDHFHYDWGLPLILLSAFIYGVIKAESGKYFMEIFKFISFRSINESASRDIGALFHWQSTLFNLASFFNISLFAFFSVIWYEAIPLDGKKLIYWLISLGIIISVFTIRHFICNITGFLSGEKEIFREYILCIYLSYRIMGLGLLILTVLILYAVNIPVDILFYSGFSLVALSYVIRVSRLFLIFINRHVSIFYLILYLCALEILPVVIIIKYVTGLV
jgi:hypothetical protein